MGARFSTKDVSRVSGRGIFFDANVLIYLFWPSGAYDSERYYASAFSGLLRQKNVLVTDFLVISEIFNRIMRIEYERVLSRDRLNKASLNYKKFRDSEEGKQVSEDIFTIIDSNILSRFSISEKPIW